MGPGRAGSSAIVEGMKGRVLVVDDDPALAEMLGIVLEADGFEPHFVADGDRALPAFRELQPDLVLLDVMMPHMDGTETFAALREIDNTRDTPIVFLTAKAQPLEVQRLLNLGAKDVLTKPFDPLEIAERVAASIDA